MFQSRVYWWSAELIHTRAQQSQANASTSAHTRLVRALLLSRCNPFLYSAGKCNCDKSHTPLPPPPTAPRLCLTNLLQAAAGDCRQHLCRRQGKQQGIPVCPVATPEVEQPLLLQAVVEALCNAGQHVQCQCAAPLPTQEHQSQACKKQPHKLQGLL